MKSYSMKYNTIPILLKEPNILLIGGGAVALQKAQVLHDNNINFKIITIDCLDEIRNLCQAIQIKAFSLQDISKGCIVIDASGNSNIAELLMEHKKNYDFLLNVVDKPELCDFYFMALTKNSSLQIAVSSNGASPTAAKYFRDKCEELIPDNIDNYLQDKQKQRNKGIVDVHKSIEELNKLTSKVYLVGCGLGDPNLLTLQAYKIIKSVDVVLYDNLISPEIMELVPQKCIRVYVGKKKGHHSKSQKDIHKSILKYSCMGLSVARLKSGDPFIFGRGAEELEFLRKEGIKTKVIAGISSAISAALLADIPITARDYASSFSVVSPHLKGDSLNLDWIELLHKKNHTVVALMGLSRIPEILTEAKRQGISPIKPCAIISNASRTNQKIIITTLEKLKEASKDASRPSILIFGEVVNF